MAAAEPGPPEFTPTTASEASRIQAVELTTTGWTSGRQPPLLLEDERRVLVTNFARNRAVYLANDAASLSAVYRWSVTR